MDARIGRFEIKASNQMNRLPNQFFSGLVSRANRYIEEGYDVINLGQGNPDLPTPLHIVRSLQEAAISPLNHKYPLFSGKRKLKEAICQWYEVEHGVHLDPDDEVAILPGTKTGLVELASILLNPGDVALVPDPGYPDYWSGIALAGANMIPMPLLRENAFLPDLESIPTEQLKRGKLIYLNYPSNPTGACAPPSFFDDAIRFAEKNKMVIAHDFAYGALGFDGKKPASFLSRPGAKEVGIEFYTLSKTYNMAGWRSGFALGNKEVIRLINLLQDHYYCSLFGAVQDAAVTALTASQDCVKELVAVYESRRNSVYREMSHIGWNASLSEGTFFTWLPVPPGYTSSQFADLLLEKVQVVVAPGSGFGHNGEGYVRAGLLTSEERLREAMQRIHSLSLF
ncbi:pyridoxal phosphate-dependent aminotransferase [Paenibacillus sp. MWE-103]|uniref:Pyridoxal phosphate-dependent aminotransferase n=1 Tax=Paenibacillus artemisiicola TaxID=1172618 RepID=A0ABS3WDT1_9BACL|nr:pyridoxal phosphate-dependent aminotransferase [Paenibacillus artemisiicola]MBO7746467.1 pyridoxal phosphate-dependent aminotransferase [Paenibacillus artemisiicola]